MWYQRFLSRKFLVALSAQVVALLVLIWPTYESEITQAAQSITALLVLLLSSLGYLAAESSVDRQRRGGASSSNAKTREANPESVAKGSS